MTLSLDELKTVIAVLPTPDRAELAHFLLHTLEPSEGEVEAEWRELAEQRAAEIYDGKVSGIPADQIWNRVEGPNP